MLFYDHHKTPEGWIWAITDTEGLIEHSTGNRQSEEECLEELDKVMTRMGYEKTGLMSPRGIPYYEPRPKIL